MKKLLTILVFFVTITTANGQTLIQDGFKTSGSMVMYWESENTDDITKADDGAKWHLEQNDGMITFWIDVPPLSLYNLSKTQWKKDITALVLNKMENGLRVYIVADLQFRHLQVIEYEKDKWLVQLCSVEFNE